MVQGKGDEVSNAKMYPLGCYTFEGGVYINNNKIGAQVIILKHLSLFRGEIIH